MAISMYDPRKNLAAPKAGYTPPVTATPYTGGSIPNMSQIVSNANNTASKSPTTFTPPDMSKINEAASATAAKSPTAPVSGGNVGIPKPDLPQAQAPIAQPVSAQQSYQPPDYAALAAARTALALQQKQTIANQQKASAQTSYDQQNLRTKDDRVLGDFSRTQTANPFGNMGRKSFQEGLIGRERTQADADASSALATQKGNIDQLLADYQNATADEQVRIADELERADRAYKLDLDKFNQGQSNWDKEFGQNQQQIDYSQNPNNPNNIGQSLNNAGQALTNQLNELKLGNYSTEQKQQAQLFEQQIKSGQMSNEAAEYNLKQLKDPKSATNQAQALDLQMKQLEAKNLPEQQRLELQQLKKQIAQIGVVHYKPQTANEIEMDKVSLQTAQEKLKQLQNPTDKPAVIDPKDSVAAYNHYKDQIDASSYTKEQKQAFAESVRGEMTASDYAKLYNDIK